MSTANPENSPATDPLSELRGRLEAVLDRDVRPDLRADGGDVDVVGIDPDLIVQIRLSGACQGCSSAAIVLAMQIESVVKAQIPEIRFLEPVP